MSESTVLGIKKLIEFRAPTLRSLSLSWFGGEPLLAKSIIYDIASHAQKQCKKYSVNFGGGLTTNAYNLDLITVKKLSSLSQANFQITLDGDQDAHDKTRLRADGSGTFSRIWSNLCAMQKSEDVFQVSLRIHVHPANKESNFALLDRINHQLGMDSRFRIHFHRVSDLGGANTGQIDVLDYDSYHAVLRKLQSHAKLKSSSELDLVERRHICYAAKANSLVIRSNGRIGKCTVALYDPRNDIGQINRDGSLQVDNRMFQLWLDGLRDMDVATLSCPLSTLHLRRPDELRVTVRP